MEKCNLITREDVELFLNTLSIPFSTIEHQVIKTVKASSGITGSFVKCLFIKDKMVNST